MVTEREFEQYLEAEWAGELSEADRVRMEELCAQDPELCRRWEMERQLSRMLTHYGPNVAPGGLFEAVFGQLDLDGSFDLLKRLNLMRLFTGDTGTRARIMGRWPQIVSWAVSLALVAVISIEAAWLLRESRGARRESVSQLAALDLPDSPPNPPMSRPHSLKPIRKTEPAQVAMSPSAPASGTPAVGALIAEEPVNGEPAVPADISAAAGANLAMTGAGEAASAAQMGGAEAPVAITDLNGNPVDRTPATAARFMPGRVVAEVPAQQRRRVVGSQTDRSIGLRIMLAAAPEKPAALPEKQPEKGLAQKLIAPIRKVEETIKDATRPSRTAFVSGPNRPKAVDEGYSTGKSIEIIVASVGGKILRREPVEGEPGMWRIRCSMTPTELGAFMSEMGKIGARPGVLPDKASGKPRYEVIEGKALFHAVTRDKDDPAQRGPQQGIEVIMMIEEPQAQ